MPDINHDLTKPEHLHADKVLKIEREYQQNHAQAVAGHIDRTETARAVLQSQHDAELAQHEATKHAAIDAARVEFEALKAAESEAPTA